MSEATESFFGWLDEYNLLSDECPISEDKDHSFEIRYLLLFSRLEAMFDGLSIEAEAVDISSAPIVKFYLDFRKIIFNRRRRESMLDDLVILTNRIETRSNFSGPGLNSPPMESSLRDEHNRKDDDMKAIELWNAGDDSLSWDDVAEDIYGDRELGNATKEAVKRLAKKEGIPLRPGKPGSKRIRKT